MDELAFSDATTLATKISKKEISSRELLDHYVARVERYNPDINAVICDQIDKARERADEADAVLSGTVLSFGELKQRSSRANC